MRANVIRELTWWLVALVAMVAAASNAVGGEYDCVAKVTSTDTVKTIGVGSGVFVTSDGWLLTARHVLGGGTDADIRVTLQDGSVHAIERRFQPFGDTENVVAVKIDAKTQRIRIASTIPAVGDIVHTAGFPLGKFSTMRSTVTSVSIRESGGGTRLIGIREPIKPGHSGGPLWNAQGKLIGIASVSARLSSAEKRMTERVDATYIGAGIEHSGGMFISLSYIRDIVRQLPRDSETGKPTLYVFSLPGCGPCEKFKSDYRSDAGWVATVLEKHYRIQMEAGTSPLAQQFSVTRVPTFATGGDLIVGYNGPKWLIDRLGVSVAPAPPAEPPSQTEETQEAIVPVEDAHPPLDDGGSLPRVPDPARPSPPVGVDTPSIEADNADNGGALVGGALGLLPALAPLLPWTLGPAAGAGIAVGGWLLRRYMQRRKQRKNDSLTNGGEAGTADLPRVSLPRRDHTETKQIIELGRVVEGRDPLSDSLRWMLAEDEAREIEDDDERMKVAQFLGRIDRRLEDIAPLSVRQTIKE